MKLPATWSLFGEEHIPYQLLLLAKMIDRESARHLQSEHNLTLAEWRVLAFIGVSGPSSASEIGTAGEIDRAEISRAVSKLIEAGLVERHQAEDNRRRLIIHATKKGTVKFRKVRLIRRAFFQEITGTLSAAEKVQLSGALEAMALELSRQTR